MRVDRRTKASHLKISRKKRTREQKYAYRRKTSRAIPADMPENATQSLHNRRTKNGEYPDQGSAKKTHCGGHNDAHRRLTPLRLYLDLTKGKISQENDQKGHFQQGSQDEPEPGRPPWARQPIKPDSRAREKRIEKKKLERREREKLERRKRERRKKQTEINNNGGEQDKVHISTCNRERQTDQK